MNTTLSLLETFEDDLRHGFLNRSLDSGKSYLILAPRSVMRKSLNTILAQIALVGAVQVLDGGNLFDFYTIARILRARTFQLEETLAHIQIARAFTCYQVCTALAQTPSSPVPLVIMDMLATFYDENVALPERQSLLQESIREVQRLSSQAPVLISTSSIPGDETSKLVVRLKEACSQVWQLETIPAPLAQMALL